MGNLNSARKMSKGIKDLKFHHEFRVTVSDCPNACSQPQIKDIGIIGARRPERSEVKCTACGACADACRENAIQINEATTDPIIHNDRCVACGQCVVVCPNGTLVTAAEGYRIQLGGKLGRHPQLAFELPGIYNTAATLGIVQSVIDIYKEKNQKGERLGEILGPGDLRGLTERFSTDNR